MSSGVDVKWGKVTRAQGRSRISWQIFRLNGSLAFDGHVMKLSAARYGPRS